jgi:hypothetical protein
VLPVDAAEARLLGLIDGRRTIGQIMRAVQQDSNRATRRARDLFARLWQYDQVVFDASRAGQAPHPRKIAT